MSSPSELSGEKVPLERGESGKERSMGQCTGGGDRI